MGASALSPSDTYNRPGTPHIENISGIVVLPTYNERESLIRIVPELLACTTLRVLIVDDDSPDGTGATAEELARECPERVAVVRRRGPRGLARSLIDGFRRAVESGADVIVQMDADLSHDPAYLPDLIAETKSADLVIGSRYLKGVSVMNWPLHRILLSTVANGYVRRITRMRVRDCTSGYRCWRRDALARMLRRPVLSDGYAFQIEMLYRARRAGCRITEVPIVFVDRRYGCSKMSWRAIAESVAIPWVLPWLPR